MLAAMRGCFRPGFLNQPGGIVRFKPLTEAEIERIVELMFAYLRSRLAGRQMTLKLSPAARRYTAGQRLDPARAAPPLRRFIAREVGEGPSHG